MSSQYHIPVHMTQGPAEATDRELEPWASEITEQQGKKDCVIRMFIMIKGQMKD